MAGLSYCAKSQLATQNNLLSPDAITQGCDRGH